MSLFHQRHIYLQLYENNLPKICWVEPWVLVSDSDGRWISQPTSVFKTDLIDQLQQPTINWNLRMEQDLNLHVREHPDFRGRTFTI